MIHFICAFYSEAKPLIDHYKLHKQKDPHPFKIYSNHKNNTSLTISGLGKTASAAAVCYSYSTLNATNTDAWINVGLAGHGSAEIGELVMAHTIRDKATDQTWYPSFAFLFNHQTSECQTVDTPSTEYGHHLIDMEASGFYQSSIRFSIYELIHVIKVVSDNNRESLKKIDKQKATNLIQDQVFNIVEISAQIKSLADEYSSTQAKPKHFQSFLSQWHFTKTQEVQLEKQLRRWDVLKPDEKPLPVFVHSKTARSLLIELSNMLDNTDINYDR